MSIDDPDSEPDPDRPPRNGLRARPRRVRQARREPDPDRPPRNGLRVVVTDGRGRVRRADRLRRWLAGVAPPPVRGEVAVALVCDRKMRDLNRRFRGVDRATDVLSFPAESGAPAAGADAAGPLLPDGGQPEPAAEQPAAAADGEPHLGDIVIATGVARRQARSAGHPLGAELRLLALHGLLHLLGYDHERDTGEMERLERRLRRRGGLA